MEKHKLEIKEIDLNVSKIFKNKIYFNRVNFSEIKLRL